MDTDGEIVFHYGRCEVLLLSPDSFRASVRVCSSASLLRPPQTGVLRAIPIKLQWTTVSSYPSTGAGVSFRLRPSAREPISGENYFALRENPFSLTPNPRFLFRTRQAHETLSRLTRGILDRRGLILLCGPVGTGKTTLLYSALHLMDVSPSVQNKIGTAVIVHPTLTPDEFLETVLDDFDVECPSSRRQWRLEALLNMLVEVRRKGGVAVLVIDEAQMLSSEVLEEVRALLTLQTSHEKLLQIVLCGQPELEGKLVGMNLRPGEPLVAVQCGTAALSLQDTHDYVEHRLRIAGARSEALFTPEAMDAVHAHTGGIPRLINLLCGHALSVASFYQAGKVFPYMVDEAAGQICSGALVAPTPETLLRTLPLRCDDAAQETILAEAVLGSGDPAEDDDQPAAIEQVETLRSASSVQAAADVEVVRREPEAHKNAEPAPLSVGDVIPADDGPTDGPGDEGSAIVASQEGSSVAASSRAANAGNAPAVRSKGAGEISATQVARKKRRALRHRAKFAQSGKLARVAGRPAVQCDFLPSAAPAGPAVRRSDFRRSPFRRGNPPKASLSFQTLRMLRQLSVRDITRSLPGWNQWLNRWCSEHFTSKSCGKALFQLGLAGTLFLALAEVISAGFPRQHLAHVAFGFLGMLFIDVSLGLGTYLLLIERRLPSGNRAHTLRRRLG
jgi:general secretion pathway protein A